MAERSLKEDDKKEENALPSPPSLPNPRGSNPSRRRYPLVRLTDKKERKELLRHGKRVASPLLVLYCRENAMGKPRYAIFTRKRLGGAVSRNRTKRILREILNGNRQRLQGYDFILIPQEEARRFKDPSIRLPIEKMLLESGIVASRRIEEKA